jgi:hypothetical protein
VRSPNVATSSRNVDGSTTASDSRANVDSLVRAACESDQVAKRRASGANVIALLVEG